MVTVSIAYVYYSTVLDKIPDFFCVKMRMVFIFQRVISVKSTRKTTFVYAFFPSPFVPDYGKGFLSILCYIVAIIRQYILTHYYFTAILWVVKEDTDDDR